MTPKRSKRPAKTAEEREREGVLDGEWKLLKNKSRRRLSDYLEKWGWQSYPTHFGPLGKISPDDRVKLAKYHQWAADYHKNQAEEYRKHVYADKPGTKYGPALKTC